VPTTVSGDIEIKASPEEIVAVLVDVEAYPEWHSVHKQARIDDRGSDGNPHIVAHTVSSMGMTDEQVLEYSWQGTAGVHWSLLKSGQQKSQIGSYVLTPTPSGTKVVYTLSLEPSIPLPGFVLKQALKATVKGATEGLKRRVESRQ
jgi:hypothetical protein